MKKMGAVETKVFHKVPPWEAASAAQNTQLEKEVEPPGPFFFKFQENSNCFCGKRSHYGLFRLSSSSGGSGEMIQGSLTFVATILTFISFLRNTNVCIFQFGNMMLNEHC